MANDQPIRSISRALDIIKVINRLRAPSLIEIATATELPYPTVFRIMQTLIHEGIVEQEPFRKRYHVTELSKSLSSGFQDDDILLGAAITPMHDFTLKHLWPVTLAIRVGNRMMVKHSTHRLTSQTFINYYPGYTLPILECASGRTYLAFCGDDERETVMTGLAGRKSRDEDGNAQLIDHEALFATIRSKGYSKMARTVHNETPGKTSALSVPILDEGRIIGSLAMVFFAAAMSMEEAERTFPSHLIALANTIVANLSVCDGNADDA